jgi:hypothetical protein
LADLSQFFSILSDLKTVVGAPSQALQIIFEKQSQGNNQKKAIKKHVFFKMQNAFFFSFFSF